MPRGVNFGTPAWPRHSYDPENTSYNPDLSTPVPENPVPQQKTTVNSGVRSNLALAGDRLILLDDDAEELQVYDPDTLALIDTFSLPGTPILNAGCAIYDDAFIYGHGAATATNFDGTERWSATNFDQNSGWITVVNDRVLVPTNQAPATFRAYDVEDGTELWTRTGGGQIGESGACVTGSQVIFADNNNDDLVAVDETDGSENWTGGLTADISFPPATDGSLVFFGDDNGNLAAFDVGDGTGVWNVSPFSGSAFSPAVADGIVYFLELGTGAIEARSVDDGSRVWNDTANTGGLCGPTVAGDHVYVQDQEAGLVAYDRVNGAPIWGYDLTGGQTVESNIIAVEGALYVYGEDGSLNKVVEG